MSFSNILSILLASILIALTVAFGIAPRFKAASTEPPAAESPPRSAPAGPPATASNAPARAAFIDREDDGHYWTRADIGGTEVKFMVDTGASIVALTYRDAQRLGLDPENLTFDSEIRTAGGVIFGAPVTLDEIRIGRVTVADVDAVVLSSDLDQSLLGMTFLGELKSYEFRQGQLIIRQ